MGEPVKLSRERWNALTCGAQLDDGRITIMIRNSGNSAVVHRPVESDGVIFLPAEYVPDTAPSTVFGVQRLRKPPLNLDY